MATAASISGQVGFSIQTLVRNDKNERILIEGKMLSSDPRKTHLIACATVWEEIQTFLPEGLTGEEVDLGLHIHPAQLHAELQRLINMVDTERETILLGFGLCSNAVVGLRSDSHTLVLPRVHDCVPLFLGSQAAYRSQADQELGTYYLTKGFIEGVDENSILDYARLDEKYGREKADRILGIMLKNYRRLALINTGNYRLEHYREVACRAAKRLGLRFEEISGSNALIRKLVLGPWDEEILVIPPGRSISEDPFYETYG
jgi:hypothetical protein